MALFVLAISLIVFGFGVAGILTPMRLTPFVLWFDNLRGLYIAAAFRILFGLALLDIAPTSQWPGFFNILGLITIAAGVILLALGLERFHKMVAWWCRQNAGILRVWFLFALIVGIFLIYATIGAAFS